jgi:hypothetical protein
VDLSTLVIWGILLALVAYFFRGLIGGVRGSPKMSNLFGSKKKIAEESHAYNKSSHLIKPDIKLIAETAQKIVNIINKSLQIANTTKNNKTKISRVRLARQKLIELKEYVKNYSFIKIDKLHDVESNIISFENELEDHDKYKYSLDDDDSYYRYNDVLKGLKFCATLQTRTPLSVLIHHGEIFSGPPSKAPQYGTMADGIWVPQTRTWRELGLDIDEMPEGEGASDAGPVRASEYLPFLIAFRKIVEGNADIKEQIELVHNLCNQNDRYREYCKHISYDFPYSFFKVGVLYDIVESPLKKQCEYLRIEVIEEKLRKDIKNRSWVLENGKQFKEPEKAALAIFEDKGYKGSFCQGGAINTLMHAASLDYLAKVNIYNSRIDACKSLFKGQCYYFKDKKEYILREIFNANETTIKRNLEEINNYNVWRVVFDGDIIIGIWKALGKDNLQKIVNKYFENSYQFSSGWPDLTLFKDNELLLLEVKTTDTLHRSQIILIRDFIKPLNLNCKVLKIARKKK